MKLLFLLTIFLSSYLLFAVQPMIAKIILPSFGGGSAVWTACMLFFQSFLLIGYFYAFVLSKLSSVKHQSLIHAAMLIIGAVTMPLTVEAFRTVPEGGQPFWEIFVLVSVGLGMPYLVLAATSPLLQYWMSHSAAKKSTYRLYSVSNVAAMLALFSYPLLLEYSLTLDAQATSWSVIFMVFAVFMGACVIKALKSNTSASKWQPDASLSDSKNLSVATLLSWFLLSATGVTLLIATTNNMTVNVPPIPFLWVLPLALYLLTYIVCFFDDKLYHRGYWKILFILLSLVAVMLFFFGTHFNVETQVVLYLFVMVSGCMICHGELAKSKPDQRDLTLFYLVLAAGGCGGSVFASVIATQIFDQYYELMVGLGLVYVLALFLDLKTNKGEQSVTRLAIFSAGLNLLGLLAFVSLFAFLYGQFNQYNIAQTRNFYGTLQVKDIEADGGTERRLIDGYTSHGAQRLGQSGMPLPLSYYRRNTGIGITLSNGTDKSRKIGVIGLGAGALAYYGTAKDEMIFYELNPSVKQYAIGYFDFLPNAQANTQVRLGDARVTLEQEWERSGSNQFDVLVIDAFSSDAIPTHLITEQALDLYRQHVKSDGILAFHISNSYLDLKPVLTHYANKLGLQGVYFNTLPDQSDEHGAEWVILTNHQGYSSQSEVKFAGLPLKAVTKQKVKWTDNFSSILSVLK